MRIGMVTGEYPPMQGGVGAFTHEVAKVMVATGHEVYAYTRQAASSSNGSGGVAVHGSVGKRWGWRENRRIRSWTEEHALDLVDIQFQTAAYGMHPAVHTLPCCIGDVPTVVTFHDLRVPYLFPKAGSLREWSVQQLAYNARGVIATDRQDYQILQQCWEIRSLVWIPIGSNVTALPPQDCDRLQWRANRNIPEDALLISYFGFLNESKGALILIEALARLVADGVSAYLVMVGGRSGSSDPENFAYGRRVDQLIEEHRLSNRVLWTGFVEDREVSEAFYASDLCTLPYVDGVSLRRGTLMAALAHGRPIVTTHGPTEVPELKGVLHTVHAGDPDALVEGIKAVWIDKDYRDQLGRQALKANEHFSWSTIAAQTLAFFESVISQQ